jgi:cytochrome c oxidase cbb3-type subunit III
MRKHISILTAVPVFLLLISSAKGQTNTATDSFPSWLNSDFYLVACSMLFLLLLVIVLGSTGINLSKAAAKIGRKSSAVILLLFSTVNVFAQSATDAAAEKPVAYFPKWADNPNVYVLAILFFVMAFAVYALYKANMRLIKYINPEEVQEVTIEAKAAINSKPHFIRRIYKKLAGGVPLAEEKDILLDHDYDGIKELDNKLPPWWIYGFYVTIIFAVIYLFNYHIFKTGKLSHDEYQAELIQADREKEERMKANANFVNEENVVALADAAEISKGKVTFIKLCSPCHKPDGGGIVGPNLTDEYWLHGGGIKNIFKIITYGVPAKGMLSWKSQLSPKQIQEVSSFILSLKGTNPPGAKEPQGDMWVEEKAPAPTDSTDSKHAAAAILLTR